MSHPFPRPVFDYPNYLWWQNTNYVASSYLLLFLILFQI